MRYYTLNSLGDPVPEPNLARWSIWMNSTDCHVAKNSIDGVYISTVFLGLDHSFSDGELPVLWETMIFANGQSWATHLDEYQQRYTSLADAKAGHKEAVGKLTQLRSEKDVN